jgi:hypothetical protein
LDIAAATGELNRLVNDIEPGDPLDGLPEAGKLRSRYPQEPVTDKTVSGWPYDVSRAIEALKAANGTIDRAMSPPMKPIGLPEVQRVEWAAGVLREATGDQAAKSQTTTRTKRRDNAVIILAALCAHHGYDGTSIMKWEAAGVRELSELTRPKEGKPVSPSTITRWFNKNFKGGHSTYERQCANEVLLDSLKKLNNDFTRQDKDIALAESKVRQADRSRDNAAAKDNS